MTEVRRFGLVDVLLLLLVLASAAGTRASYLVVCAENGTNAGPWRVQDDPPQELLSLALNLKERNWFGSEAPLAAAHQQELTAHTAPAYPWLLSLVARLPVVFDPAVRWLQVGLGTLTAGLYFLFARRAFRSRFVALLAGLLCACHPFWVVNAAEMNDGVLTSFLLALVLVLGARSSEVEDAFCCLVFGLALAALALVRAALLPLSFVALLWFLLRCRSLPRGWLFALLATLGFANGLAPWILRNYQATGELIPVVDSLYLHLWIGNNPQAGGGPQSEEVLLRTLAEARKESSGNLADMPQSRRYEELAGEVWQEIRRPSCRLFPAPALGRPVLRVRGEVVPRSGTLAGRSCPLEIDAFLAGRCLPVLPAGLLAGHAAAQLSRLALDLCLARRRPCRRWPWSGLLFLIC